MRLDYLTLLAALASKALQGVLLGSDTSLHPFCTPRELRRALCLSLDRTTIWRGPAGRFGDWTRCPVIFDELYCAFTIIAKNYIGADCAVSVAVADDCLAGGNVGHRTSLQELLHGH